MYFVEGNILHHLSRGKKGAKFVVICIIRRCTNCLKALFNADCDILLFYTYRPIYSGHPINTEMIIAEVKRI